MKVDMHVHTICSNCSINPIKVLKKVCSVKKIFPIIADHNLLTKVDFGIPGEEIATEKGEFIGAFLNEQVNEKDIFEAMDRVKEQGGLIYLPHPFDGRRRRALCRFDILNNKDFIKKVDIVEVFNSRCIEEEPNIMAYEYAKINNLLMGVGSDSHFPWELGNAYMEVDEFDKDNPKEFLRVLKKNNNIGDGLNYYAKLGTPLNILFFSKLSKKLRKWGVIKNKI
ncbi:PHP domain-containing protein [Methanothermococcus okinawensis]|uniref:PHP domain protein n=1 Tax=Methanothermococcus okinawensis (strain DSM 14208 / JCM 11175 / IH1) TaxID=647113 RepID=F8ALF4_METOI|nr:PHP-associated domain-containing protein [Methanothermococcus okinawensis]AEH06543.1 PHP domain protein [Methanothermococcus okinawensis IH1]